MPPPPPWSTASPPPKPPSPADTPRRWARHPSPHGRERRPPRPGGRGTRRLTAGNAAHLGPVGATPVTTRPEPPPTSARWARHASPHGRNAPTSARWARHPSPHVRERAHLDSVGGGVRAPRRAGRGAARRRGSG